MRPVEKQSLVHETIHRYQEYITMQRNDLCTPILQKSINFILSDKSKYHHKFMPHTHYYL